MLLMLSCVGRDINIVFTRQARKRASAGSKQKVTILAYESIFSKLLHLNVYLLVVSTRPRKGILDGQQVILCYS
jgi:hypothetical protein